MRSTVLRRTTLAASAGVLALLATACGGSSDDGDKGGDGSTAQAGQAGETASAAKALSAAELAKAVLAQADVKSGKLSEVAAKDDVAQDKAKADDEACAPLTYLQVGSYVGKPSASVKRSWIGDAKKPSDGADAEDTVLAGIDRAKVIETLASYQGGGAEQAMKDLKTAAQKCAGGFSYTVTGTKNEFTKVAVTQAPDGADEALALTLTMDAEGVKAPVKAVVVRKGATLAYFPAINFASAATGKDFDFPAELVQAQLAKLG